MNEQGITELHATVLMKRGENKWCVLQPVCGWASEGEWAAESEDEAGREEGKKGTCQFSSKKQEKTSEEKDINQT